MNHNQTISVRRFNAFTARLTSYMIDFHPDRIDEVDFIDQRGQMAADVFHQCSVRGMTVDESMHEAEKTLYAGLHFSPYLMLEEIVYNHFRYTDDEDELGEFTMQMLDMVKPLINDYAPGDDFKGTYEYTALYGQIIQNINDYLTSNGLQ